MERDDSCPLTPALLEILQAAWNLGDFSDQAIAKALNRSSNTIHQEIQRMFEMTGVHRRAELLMVALKRGWLR